MIKINNISIDIKYLKVDVTRVLVIVPISIIHNIRQIKDMCSNKLNIYAATKIQLYQLLLCNIKFSYQKY